jgi:hypothetical protein
VPAPLTVALPPGLDLRGGCIIRLAALDAATGNEVAGVKVSNITLEVDDIGGGSLQSGAFVPLLRSA